MEADASTLDMPSDCCYFVEKAAAAGAAPAFQYFDSIFHHFAVVTQNLGQTHEYQSDSDLPGIKEGKPDGVHQIMAFLVVLEAMILILQFMTTIILQNLFFGVLSFLPFVAVVGGFEYAYQKRTNERTERTSQFRKRFYKISAWLRTYFPVRFVIMSLATFYPHPIHSLVLECVAAVVYLMAAALITLELEKRALRNH